MQSGTMYTGRKIHSFIHLLKHRKTGAF